MADLDEFAEILGASLTGGAGGIIAFLRSNIFTGRSFNWGLLIANALLGSFFAVIFVMLIPQDCALVGEGKLCAIINYLNQSFHKVGVAGLMAVFSYGLLNSIEKRIMQIARGRKGAANEADTQTDLEPIAGDASD